jgi:hypothetical protein
MQQPNGRAHATLESKDQFEETSSENSLYNQEGTKDNSGSYFSAKADISLAILTKLNSQTTVAAHFDKKLVNQSETCSP